MQWALEMRRALELPGFLLAAGRASEADLDGLEPLVAGLATLEHEPEELYLLDHKFHRDVV